MFALSTGANLPPTAVVNDMMIEGSAVWVATEEGLYRLGPDDARFGTDSGLSNNAITGVEQDGSGRLWVTTIAGTSLYEDGHFVDLPDLERTANSQVYSLASQADSVWFGTLEDGLYRFNGRALRHFGVEDGLASNRVTSLHPDSAGRLWICTNGGLSIYRFVLLQTLNAQDGQVMTDRRGRVWMGTVGGGVVRRRLTPSSPSVFVDAIVTTHRMPPAGQIELTTAQDLLAFEVSGVSLKTRPGGLRYRYRLAGHDDWRTTSSRRIEYADLPTGDFVFEVQAIDRDLGLTPEPARVRVSVSNTSTSTSTESWKTSPL